MPIGQPASFVRPSAPVARRLPTSAFVGMATSRGVCSVSGEVGDNGEHISTIEDFETLGIRDT